MIVDQIYRYLDGEGSAIPDAVMETATGLMGRSIARNLGEKRKARPRNPSPSSNWGCARRIFFDALTNKIVQREPVTARSLLAFTMGDVLEQVGVLLARQAGVSVVTPDEDGKQREIVAEIGGVEMGMHLDMTVLDPVYGEVPVDWKSSAEFGFREAEKAAKDPAAPWWADNRDGYIAQVRLYMMGMRLAGYGSGDIGLLCYVNKNTGHMCEIRIERDNDEEDRLVRKIVWVSNAISEWKNAQKQSKDVEMETYVPPHPYWFSVTERANAVQLPDGEKGPCMELDTKFDKSRHEKPFHGWKCSYCPYTLTCNPGYGLVAMSDGPRYRKPLPEEAE